MFAGHYAVSFAAKAAERRLPLWVLFIAAQLPDVLWAPLVLNGVEKVRIIPAATAADRLDLYYMPYTHTLTAAFLWSAAVFVGYRWWRRDSGIRTALLAALAVLSHWLLDAVMHKPDMALATGATKVGLHLWRWPVLSLFLEGALLFGSMGLLLRGQARGTASLLAFGMGLLAMQVGAFYGPPLPSDRVLAVTGFMGLVSCAAFIAWWERRHLE